MFNHLENRSKALLEKYILPIIDAEQKALEASEPLPDPDYDNIAAFRLLSHAELEGYFERKANFALNKIQKAFDEDKILTKDFASLIFLHFLLKDPQTKLNNPPIERGELKKMATEAIGFCRHYIKCNNGIKENSIKTLAAIMGFFGDELDDVLLRELDQYGVRRGDVAHDSWTHNTRTFESADIEKSRLERILRLIKSFFEI